ncbi:MAG TPA: acyltransferase domain-containing protein [Casimicrobiaceae bacterium]|nr:acyltransferase domain-containing protein [Casimicrobiaceae bacterium]
MSFAVLCPGQGGQHGRMLDAALAAPESAAVIDAATQALHEDPRDWLAREEVIFANRVAQPLICIAACAMWRGLRSHLPTPVAFAGYSVGELACYALADTIEPAALAALARRRAELMDQAAASHPGALVAVRGLNRTTLRNLLEPFEAAIAIANGEDAFVVGVRTARLEGLEGALAQRHAHTTLLPLGLASHTPLMSQASGPWRDALLATPLAAPRAPVIAGVDASPVFTRRHAIDTLVRQVDHTVEWARCLDALYERGCRVFLELGPGRALARMARERFDDVEARSVEEFRDPIATVPAWVRQRLESA